MKIYILPIDQKFQPQKQMILYPMHNRDYGVEQDFLNYIKSNNDIITDNPSKADWHYLPVFWTRWHVNHNFANEGINELQESVDQAIIDDAITFTICQYDDGPVVNIGKTLEFLSSRKGEKGIDIPLLCDPHKFPFFTPKKKFLATFVGRLSTHPIRSLMAQCLQPVKQILIEDGDFGTRHFVKRTLESYISLAPRGYGGSSFRFYESMQLGTIPFLIGDIDTRPFKKYINWSDFSLFARDESQILQELETIQKRDMVQMGQSNKNFYTQYLSYQKWCKFVLFELEEIL